LNKKLTIIAISIFFCILSLSTSYALDLLNKEEYAEYWFDPSFTSFSITDNEFDIDVASVSVVISSYDLIDVSILNTYPGYEAYIEFTVSNVGDPVYITSLSFGVYDSSALMLNVFDIVPGTLLGSDEEITGLLVVTILEGALQNSIYDFDVFIDFGDTFP